MRYVIAGFVVSAGLLLAVIGLRIGWGSSTQTSAVVEASVPALRLPMLESEESPYFSREVRYDGEHKVEEILSYRKDQSVARLLYWPDGKTLKTVECYRNDAGREQRVYVAEYDATGRWIIESVHYDGNGQKERVFVRDFAGKQSHHFFRAGKLIQKVEIDLDGSQTTTDYTSAEPLSLKIMPPPSQPENLVYWDAGKTQVRLRVAMLGSRLKSWEYLGRTGTLEHRGEVLADGSLKFEFLENGKIKRTQLWKLLGEDWERSYYGMSCTELLADDGKTVEHKVCLRSNGSLKSHERFNGKTGKLEMHRDFDLEGRVERIEDFTVTGTGQKLWVFPPSGARSRGFVPSGMRDYPGEDKAAGNVYNLDGMPFSHSVMDRHPWSFFKVPAAK